MQRTVVDSAQRHDVFVADFAAERPRLHEAQVVRIGAFSSADDTGLSGDEPQVLLAAMASRFGDGQSTVRDPGIV
jgi:hypothetical protein